MSAVRELTAVLISAGMEPADAAALVARAGAEFVVAAPSKAALRTRRWRENLASQTVTGDGSVTVGPNVTERHKPSRVTFGDDASLYKKERKKEEKEESKGTTRGARLPDGWTPTPQDWAMACELLSEPRAKAELEKFTDHWKQQPGSRGVKLDWNAAWRNWTRRAAEYGAQKNGRRTVHDAARDFHENLLDRIAAFDEPAPSSLCGGEGAGVVRLLPPRRRE